MQRRDLSMALIAATTAAAIVPERAFSQSCTSTSYPQTPAEIAAGVTPTNYCYPPGVPERYGAVGNGVANDTAAFQQMIASNVGMTFTAGKIYGVTTITFPGGPAFVVNFNGASIRGIAAGATTCVVSIQATGSTFIAYDIDLNFNTNYVCGTWWYNASASAQYNSVFGMKHRYGVRAMVYGALPGSSSTGFAQSENSIYGWRTRGIQNPFYGNHSNGVLFFGEPIFVALNEEWPQGAFNWAAARAFENYAGTVHVDSGEIEMAGSSSSVYAADLSGCWFQGSVIETNVPIQIIGDGVRLDSGRAVLLTDSTANFYVKSGVTGQMVMNDMYFQRPSGVGSYSGAPFVDARAANPAFEVILNDCQSYEWRWSLISGDVRLVLGGVPRYARHRLSITAADPNVYMLTTAPTDSLLDGAGVDRFGYSLRGWYGHNDFGSSFSFSNAGSGPPGYLSSSFALSSSGQGVANTVDPTSLATLIATALYVRPGDLFLLESWVQIVSGTNVRLTARFYDISGALLSETVVADSVAAITTSWKFIQGLLAVPQSAAYMGVGVFANLSSAQWTDFRVTRAS